MLKKEFEKFKKDNKNIFSLNIGDITISTVNLGQNWSGSKMLNMPIYNDHSGEFIINEK